MGGNYREIGRGRAAFASGTRGRCRPRPPTPADERFRIRRFLWNMPVRKPVLRIISACRVHESRTFRILSGSAAYLPDVLWHFSRLVCALSEPRTLGAKRFHKFGPSPASKPGEPQRCSGLLWPRLTSAALSNRLAAVLARRHGDRSLRVRLATFLPYIRRIYVGSLPDDIGLRVFAPSRPAAVASDAVRVPRTGSLPAASFRFRLAADTLAVRLGVPVIKASTGSFIRPVASRLAFAYRFAASGHDAAHHA